MYLHAGGNVLVRKKDIIGIFDIDNMNTEETMKNFLRKAEKKGEKVIFSTLASQILVKRGEIAIN